MKPKARFLWLAPALMLGCTIAQAGSGVRMYEHGEIPAASDVADILGGGAVPMNRPKMRGISLDPSVQQKDKRIDEGLAKVAAPQDTAIGLRVEFGFDSAEIAPAYMAQLDAVAEGIKMTNGVKVVVEGHTDAHGPEAYNRHLSVERANAVKRYLMQKHGIGESQLVIKGLGESTPLQADPFASANRRVQFRAAR